MVRIAVPELVATIRERAGLTQEALARELGVSFPTVNAWERGRSHPRQAHVDQLCAFADRLGISRGLTVLVIDDDPVSCAVLESLLDLSELPVTTITAQNGSLG
ncbi:MAG: multiprotein-bridging factor 1 family protein, partial [Acidimicrobiia bacterium]